ncbi:hypothetical protein JTM08_33840, partial [Pseudomonas aeruginosa]|nr:hypothetical protein [Pseudomonas aeruginosa]
RLLQQKSCHVSARPILLSNISPALKRVKMTRLTLAERVIFTRSPRQRLRQAHTDGLFQTGMEDAIPRETTQEKMP